MAPGRGMRSMVIFAAIVGCTVAAADTVEQIPRLKFRHSSSSLHPSEWIAGPNGYLYQFHIGEQSWLAAREFCLAENADLVSIKTKDQLSWILQHYAPTHPSFEERYVQIGLVSVDGSTDFGWVDGTPVDQSIVEWATLPKPSQGTRCAQLRVNDKKVESVSCDDAGSALHINRFICQRSSTVHNEQQRSNNYIWRKLENLLNYFGFASENTTTVTKKDEEDDYWQAVESLTETEKKVIAETAQNLTAAQNREEPAPNVIEGSGQEDKTISEANSASREEKLVDEKRDEAVDAGDKKVELKEVEESLPMKKEIKEEVKSETVQLPEKKKEEEDPLNKSLPLRELLDTEEGSGSALTEAANIENSPEADSDLLATAIPKSESDIDNMINRMEKLLEKMEEKREEKKEIGPIVIEKATTAAPELIPIGPIIIEKAKNEESNVVSGDEKVVDSAKETLPEAESSEEKKKVEPTDEEDADLLVNIERTTLASTENKKPTVDDEHKEKLEGDFDGNEREEMEEMGSLVEQVPVPKNSLNPEGDLDCDEKEGNAHLDLSSSSQQKPLSEEQQKQLAEFLSLLRVFLMQARHDDLRSVIDDDSSMSLIERMKKAISIAKQRETEKQLLMLSMKPSEAAEFEKKEKASLMNEKEREEVYEEIKNAIKEGIMHDNADSSSTTLIPDESATEQTRTTVPEKEIASVAESTTAAPERTIVSEETSTVTTTEASLPRPHREGRVRIRIRTLAEVMEEERLEKERLEKEAERIRSAEEKISGALQREVEKEKEGANNYIIPLPTPEEKEEIELNEISVGRPSRLRFAGVKTFVTGEDKKMIAVKGIDSISVLQSKELARKAKSDELRQKLEESLARRAAMREAVRARNEHLRRRIEEERESFLDTSRRVRRGVDQEEMLRRGAEKRQEIRMKILEREESEIKRLKKKLAEVKVENDRMKWESPASSKEEVTTKKPKKKEEEEEKATTLAQQGRIIWRVPPSTTTTSSPTTTRPLTAFEQKMDTNHLLNIISKMERQRPTVINRSATPTTIDRVFSNLGQDMHDFLTG